MNHKRKANQNIKLACQNLEDAMKDFEKRASPTAEVCPLEQQRRHQLETIFRLKKQLDELS